jgi:hypothetical protein
VVVLHIAVRQIVLVTMGLLLAVISSFIQLAPR